MTRQLIYLSKVDNEIAKQHKQWLKDYFSQYPHLSRAFTLEELKKLDFGLAEHPHLWPSNRAGKTPLTEKPKCAADFIFTKLQRYRSQSRWRNLFKSDPLDSQQFEKDYREALKLLKEKFLLKALAETIGIAIKRSNGLLNMEELEKLKQISPLYTQYRKDWLKKHYDSTVLFAKMRAKLQAEIKNTSKQKKVIENKNTSKKIIHLSKKENHNKKIQDLFIKNLRTLEEIKQLVEQSEILLKRYIDIYYEKNKKMTKAEYHREQLATITLSIGLWSGIAAAAFSIAGCFFPVFFIPAAVFGYISFTSSIRTCLTLYKVVDEAQHKRSPSVGEVRDLIMDALLFPCYFFGYGVIMGVSKAVTSVTHASSQVAKTIHHVFSTIANVWDNVLSNLDDLIDVKEAFSFSDMKQAISGYDAIKNTNTATSWSYLKRKLVQDDVPLATSIATVQMNKIMAKEIAKETAQEIKELGGTTAPYQFNYVLFKSHSPEHTNMQPMKSYHQAILNWKFTVKLPTQAKALLIAYEKYTSLLPDATLFARKEALSLINNLTQQPQLPQSIALLRQFVELELKLIEAMLKHLPDGKHAYLLQTRSK